MFKLTLMIALIAFGISKYNEKYNCTDDGCPDFYDEIEVPLPDENIRGDLREIEKDWKQAVVVPYREIELKYAVHKVVQKEYNLPQVDISSNERFVKSLNSCINYLYEYIQPEYHIPNELIIAQAVIETGWGKSRFANEGNNLFGIRTWDKDEPYLVKEPKSTLVALETAKVFADSDPSAPEAILVTDVIAPMSTEVIFVE